MEEIKLTPGSRYLVRSVLTREQALETDGVFKGITTIGTSDALVLEVQGKDAHKGKLRCIPTHMITSLDIVESVKPADEAKHEDENVHYG